MIKPIPILLYHSISDESAPKFKYWRVSVAAFKEQMALLASKNYTTLTVSELVAHLSNPGETLPEKTVVLTFDDALCDFYQLAYPSLLKYHIPATLYVPTGYIGHTSQWLTRAHLADYPMINWDELNEISGNGIECGGHTHTHIQLDLVSKDVAYNEITRCKMELEQHLQRPVATFAYPNGYCGGHVRDLVLQAGFTSACAVKNALSFSGDDTYALARVFITPYMSLTDFEHVTLGRAPHLALRRERLRTKIWRRARTLFTLLEK